MWMASECKWNSLVLFLLWHLQCWLSMLLRTVSSLVDNRIRIATLFEEMAHFLWFVGKIGVITTKTSKSKKLSERDGVFDVGSTTNLQIPTVICCNHPLILPTSKTPFRSLKRTHPNQLPDISISLIVLVNTWRSVAFPFTMVTRKAVKI